MHSIPRWLAPLIGAGLLACGGGDPAGPSVPVASIRVDPAEASVLVGVTIRLKATAFDEAGAAIGNVDFRWKTSNSAIALIEGDGYVTTTRPGDVTITARAGGAQASALLRVIDPRGR